MIKIQSSQVRLALWIGMAAAIFYVLANGILPTPVAAQPSTEAPAASAPVTSGLPQTDTLGGLIVAGGIFMIPIFGFSFLAGTFVIERFIGLRGGKVLPRQLVDGLGQVAASQGTFDPRRAYKLCQEYPSAAAAVIRSMLLKVGRPIAEIESAVAHASQREADKLYANVRWLNISASLATMLGLIGTIQGMIMAFQQLTMLNPGSDRTQVLAAGIYTALITTFAGLCVAIPAAFFSHYFEGRIQSAFREIDELIFTMMPLLERYEGRVRFSRQNGDGDTPPTSERPAPATAGRE